MKTPWGEMRGCDDDGENYHNRDDVPRQRPTHTGTLFLIGEEGGGKTTHIRMILQFLGVTCLFSRSLTE